MNTEFWLGLAIILLAYLVGMLTGLVVEPLL